MSLENGRLRADKQGRIEPCCTNSKRMISEGRYVVDMIHPSHYIIATLTNRKHGASDIVLSYCPFCGSPARTCQYDVEVDLA